ncbi:MAG: hypothetical protein JWN04_683 [Myxococcaceae bacterium]|nr:hypothetical protein [Myxococcaceae bacterium]
MSAAGASSEGWSPVEREDDDAGNELFLLSVFGRAVSFMWTVPRLFDDPSLVRYGAYPYADGPGLIRSDDDDALLLGLQRPLALQMDVESGFLLQGVVPGSFAMRLQLPRRFEVSTRVSLLSDVSQANQGMAAASTSHVSYRFAQMRRAEFRTGVGLRNYTLGTIAWGIDVLYAVDAYLSRWSVIRAELHAGTLGSAFAAQARVTVGVMVKRCELYAGYDQTAFFGPEKTALGGPIAGIRAWF